MKSLINIQQSDFNGQKINAVSARELHKFLEVTSKFADWIKNRIEKYEFEENQDFICVSKILETQRTDGQKGKVQIQEYYLSLDMAKELAMVENNDKGRQARKYFIECERKALEPNYSHARVDYLNMPKHQLLRMMADEAEQKLALENRIQEERPYTNLGKMITLTDGTVLVGDYAIMLQNDHSIKIGQNRLFEWLREHDYLCKDGNNKNRPTQKSMELGLFTWTERIVTHNSGKSEVKFTPRLTGKAQVYFIDKLQQEFTQVA